MRLYFTFFESGFTILSSGVEDAFMLAVVEQGSKQYLVRKGQVISVEKISAEPGKEVEISCVKCVLDEEARPHFGVGTVKAKVLAQERGEKLVIFKKRRRKNSRRRNGHRQYVTILRVTDVTL
nr:50S ribosomal protein L21 [Neorickettsia sennetsu]